MHRLKHSALAALLGLTLAGLAATPPPSMYAAGVTITVTSVADVVADDGVCTLPEAVASANSGAASGATAGECAPGGPTTLITFAPALSGQPIALTTANDSAVGPSGLGVTSDITIDGLAGGITIARSDAAPSMRLFYVAPTGRLTLRRLTVHGGVARGANGGGVFSSSFNAGGGGGAGLGGAIFNRGALSVEASTLTGNQAIGGDGGSGGYFPPTNAFAYHWLVSNILGGFPLLGVYQYIASGALGDAAFQGGIATALLGVFFHFFISFVVAGVFFLSAERIPLLRRYPISASLLYGLGVFIVMSMIVVPFSATPALPPPTAAEISIQILAHMLISGLPLGILVRRNARADA